jgi:hypothetical protein
MIIAASRLLLASVALVIFAVQQGHGTGHQ